MDESPIMSHISELVAEEHQLRSRHVGEGLSDVERARLQAVEADLDQCWDLLRQRRAKVEFGADPDTAEARPTGEVESYLQ
ncbi:MAG TPA: DUF2630 family protein [Mycobacteriales bacterium]|nr:DUF2630 family protein [Mycobacteriales bacterium]